MYYNNLYIYNAKVRGGEKTVISLLTMVKSGLFSLISEY